VLIADEAEPMAEVAAEDAVPMAPVAPGLGETVVVVAVPAGVEVVVELFSQPTSSAPATRPTARGIREGWIRDMSFPSKRAFHAGAKGSVAHP
jgi:hypothetical protein